jgi:hypothetical protein
MRHYLDGRPVHTGDLLERRSFEDVWVLGRYEWNWPLEARPFFHEVGGSEPWELGDAAELRWPPERTTR